MARAGSKSAGIMPIRSLRNGTVTAPPLTIQDIGLENFATYQYTVTAVNPVGLGEPATIQEMAGLVPGAPQAITVWNELRSLKRAVWTAVGMTIGTLGTMVAYFGAKALHL